jgi:hypothetical protein
MLMEKNRERTNWYLETNPIYRPYGEKHFNIYACSNEALSVDVLLTF